MDSKEALGQGSSNENPAQILEDMPSFEKHLSNLEEKTHQAEPETVNLADVKEALFNDIKNTSNPLDLEYKLAILGNLPNIDKRTDIIEVDKLHSYKDELSFGDKVNREMKSENLNKEFSIGPYIFNEIPNWNDKSSQSFEKEKIKNYYREASERAMAREILLQNGDKNFDSWSEDDKSEVAILSLLPHYNHDIDAIILDYVKEERPTFSRAAIDNNPEHPYAKLKYNKNTTQNFLEDCNRFRNSREKMNRVSGKAYEDFESNLKTGEFEYQHRENTGDDEFWYATANE